MTIDTSRVKLILFDLDGTLVDSVGDLAWSCNGMLQHLQRPTRSTERIATWVGNGVERLVKRALTNDMHAEPDQQLFEQALAKFNQLYADNISQHSQIYPGVLDTLEHLTNAQPRLACVTNKDERFTLPLLEQLGILSYFELVVGGDTTVRKKPDPMQLEYAAAHFGIAPADCLMVGDSSNDIKAARAAGFQVVAVPYGYNHGVDIRISDPDLVVDNLMELAGLFEHDTACSSS